MPILRFFLDERSIRLGVLAGLWLLLGASVVAQRKNAPTSTPATDSTLTRYEVETLFTDGMRYVMTDEPTKALAIFDKLLARKPDLPAVQYAKASVLLKSGQVADALPSARKAHQLDPANAYYALQLAEIHVKQKRYAEAEVLYEAVIKQSADNAEYGVELAAIYLFDDKPDKALTTYERVEVALGPNEEISRQKQRIYLRQNNIDKAVAEAEKIAAIEPGDPDLLLEGAELLIANDRATQALGWIGRALKLNPDLPQAHILLAEIYRKQGDTERVKQELQLVLANPALDANLKARILANYAGLVGNDQAGQADALGLAEQLATTSPRDAKAQTMLAELLLQAARKPEARNAYARAARLDGTSFEVWSSLLQLDADLNQPDSLLAHSTKALEFFPTQGTFWYYNGTALLTKKQYSQAVEALEECRNLVTTNNELTKAVNAQLGDAYNNAGEPTKSNEAYEQVLKLDPYNDYVLNNYSYFLALRNENLSKARQMSQRLVERNPTNGTFLDTHAWVLYMNKEYPAAREYIEKTIQTDPTRVSATILEHYGDILFRLGERDKALEQWRLARAKGNSSERLNQKITTQTLP
jgi:tetratricopeptide (TPR) repeat protein